MCHLSLPIGFVPKDTAISPSGSLMATLDSNKITVIRWKFRSRSPEPALAHHQLPGTNHHIRQIIFLDENTICALGNDKNCHSVLFSLSLEDGGFKDIIFDTEVSLICALPGEQAVVCHERGGNIFIRRLQSGEDLNLYTLPTFCSTIVSVCYNEDVRYGSPQLTTADHNDGEDSSIFAVRIGTSLLQRASGCHLLQLYLSYEVLLDLYDHPT